MVRYTESIFNVKKKKNCVLTSSWKWLKIKAWLSNICNIADLESSSKADTMNGKLETSNLSKSFNLL